MYADITDVSTLSNLTFLKKLLNPDNSVKVKILHSPKFYKGEQIFITQNQYFSILKISRPEEHLKNINVQKLFPGKNFPAFLRVGQFKKWIDHRLVKTMDKSNVSHEKSQKRSNLFY